ncbi:hypothetical protein QAD02_000918 [Eretmocerus hayati]|uniref:Uncharacterized protein n=1 Tax=Eretmocerus hayati TaxID=131215 RepID=A0ACC2NEZ9_9HYME|nr:hypothetical protein QAD02_000918 [Eretmocerus hayati]
MLPGTPIPSPMPSLSSNIIEISDSRSNEDSNQAPDPRSMLMESNNSGTALEEVSKEERILPKTDDKSNLLDEIRRGITLKPVPIEQRPTETGRLTLIGPLGPSTEGIREGSLPSLESVLSFRRAPYWSSESEESSEESSDSSDDENE